MRILLWLLLLSLPAASRPPLRLELYSYEGMDYTCHVRDGHVWYEWQAQKLARRRLSQAELAFLEALLAKQNFRGLPRELRSRTVDSFDSLTVWDQGAARKVTATTSYDGPRKAEFRRFQAVVKGIRKVAPLPRFDASSVSR